MINWIPYYEHGKPKDKPQEGREIIVCLQRNDKPQTVIFALAVVQDDQIHLTSRNPRLLKYAKITHWASINNPV